MNRLLASILLLVACEAKTVAYKDLKPGDCFINDGETGWPHNINYFVRRDGEVISTLKGYDDLKSIPWELKSENFAEHLPCDVYGWIQLGCPGTYHKVGCPPSITFTTGKKNG